MHVKTAFFSLILLLALGCQKPGSDQATPLTILALDTSASAETFHKAMFSRATELIQEIPEGQKLYLYRFDSSPAEVLSESPPAATDEIAQLLNRVLEHKSNTEGTNLDKLFVEINKRVGQLNSPVQVVVFTDCGIEQMRPSEIDDVKKITQSWQAGSKVDSLTIYGLKDDFRSKLRDMISMQDDKFQIMQ